MKERKQETPQPETGNLHANKTAEMATDELLRMQEEISAELKKRNGKITVTLEYNRYKGTGKAWVAEIDQYGKIVAFLDVIGSQKNGYQGEKTYELCEGKKYRINEVGSKSYDTRYDAIVVNGKIKRI